MGCSTLENVRLPNRLSSFFWKSSSTYSYILICYSWSEIISSLLFIIFCNTLRSSNNAFLCSLYYLFFSSLSFRAFSICSSFDIFLFSSSSFSEYWECYNVCTLFPKLISVLYYFSSDLLSKKEFFSDLSLAYYDSTLTVISSYSYYNIT